MNENINVNVSTKKKRKIHFNLIDFLLIIIALMLVFVLVYVFLPNSFVRGLFADHSVDVEYSIEFKGVDESFLECIRENDVVIDSVSKCEIGNVTAVDYSTQYTELKYDETTQKGILSVVPGKNNVIVTISGKANFSEDRGYDINGVRIAVGELISARFPNFAAEGYCISVSVN